jgi:Domain of unknown function (DUF3846)
MATQLYATDGTITRLAPPNGVHWTQEELQKLVGGYIEICRTNDGQWMVVNELGKVTEPMLPLNIAATKIYQYGRHDPIVGPAVVIDNRLELDGPEKDDDA